MKKQLRKFSMVFMYLGILGFFLLGSANLPTIHAAGEVWTFVDGNLSSGLNKNGVRIAENPVMAVFNNELYVAWNENYNTTSQIRVRQYDGSTWSWVDGGGDTGINYSTGENAIFPNLLVFNGNLYAIWSETRSGVNVTRVKRYDGDSTWTSIDGSATNGLNKDSATCGSTSGPSFGVCNGYLYAAWVEGYSGAGGAYQLHVKRYDGGTTWAFVDGGGFTGLNIDTSKSANKPKLLAINNVLYLIWTENNGSGQYQIRVKRYDGGSTWTTVDGGNGLNYSSGNTVDEARLVVYNNSLYAYWVENYTVRLKSYNGSAWGTADSNAGFKQNTYNYSYPEAPPAAIPYGNKLYFTWGEDITVDPWAYQTRACYYNSGTMTFIDGNDSTRGLNYDWHRYAYKQAIVEYNGTLYVAWHEDNGSAYQIRVRSTPLPAMITSVTVPANGWYKTGQNLDFTVTFNKAVNVTGTPIIPITLTGGAVNASYYSGNGTNNLTFRYKIVNGNADADGIAVGTNISLNGGTIRDTASGLDAEVNLNNVASTAGVLVDTVAPTLVGATRTDNTHLTVTLSENCINLTKANNGGFTVYQIGNTAITYAVTAVAQGADAGHAVLTVADTSASGSKGVVVKYSAGTNGTIRDNAGNAMATNSTGVSIPAWDTTAPTLVSAAYSDNTHVIITLSEDCKSFTKTNNGGFTVCETGNPSKTYAVSATAQGADAAHVRLTVANMGVSGRKGVTVKYAKGTYGTIQDTAGNAMATNSTGVNAAAWDTLASTLLSVTRTDDTHLNVALSESCINLTKTNNGGFTVTETGSAVTYAVTATAKGSDTSHIVLTVANMVISGKEGVTVKYTAGGNGTIQDIAGNVMATDGTGVTAAGWETTAPAITTGVLASSNAYIDLTFSEGVYGSDTGTGAIESGDLVLNFTQNTGNATGVTINSIKKNNGTTVTSATALAGGETAVRVFLTVTGIPSGAETIEIKPASASSIYDKAGNAVSDGQTTGVKDLKDKYAPTLVGASWTDNTHLVVALSENCKNLKKTNNGGFTVFETGNPSKTYAVSATAQGVDAAHVRLTVANMGVSGRKGVTVKYAKGTYGTIQDTAGNAMATNIPGVNVAAWDSVAPSIASATLAASNGYMDIVFNEGVYGTVNGTGGLATADLALTFTANGGTATNAVISSVKKPNSTSASTASALTGGESVIRVFLKITGTPSGVETIEVKPANGTSIYDLAGNAVSAAETIGAKVLTEKIAPTLVSATRTDNTHITVTLSENCVNLAKTNNGGFTVTETGKPTITYAVTGTAQGADAGHVILTVTDMGVSGKEGVTVKYTAGTYGTIRDNAGNALATNSTGLAIAPWELTAPTITSITRTDNTHLLVTLSENCANLKKANNGGFTVAESTDSSKTYAVTATAQGADAAHVVLTVANMGVSGKEGVTVKYTKGTYGTIQDVAGNALDNNGGVSIAPWHTVAPAISSAALAASNGYIDIVFSEGVYGTVNGTGGLATADLALTFTANGGTATNAAISSVKKNNSTSASTASALTGGESVIRVFLKITGTPSGVETIKVKPADDTSIYDLAGNAMSATQTSGANTLNDKLPPTLASGSRTDNTHLVVVLSEDCTNITKASNGGFIVTDKDNPTVTYAVTAIAQGVDSHHVVLTVADMSASAFKGVKIKYTSGTKGTVRDTVGNAMATNSVGVEVLEWAWASLVWQDIGSAFGNSHVSEYSKLRVYQGKPYIAFSDSNASYKATVWSYNSDTSTWGPLGTAVSDGMASYPNLFSVGNTLYLSYEDSYTGDCKATILKYDSGSWSTVGTRFSGYQILENSLAVYNDKPYLVCQERYTGTPAGDFASLLWKDNSTWNYFGGAQFSNPDQINIISLALYNGKPYIAYLTTGGNVVVKYYASATGAGSTWNTVGGPTYAGSGYINIGVGSDGILYLAYNSYAAGGSGKMVVQKYNGTWSNLPAGSSWVTDHPAPAGDLFIDGNSPFIAYYDSTDAKIYVKKYVGNAWVTISGGGITPGCSVGRVSIFVENNIPYLAYEDSTNHNIIVKKAL